MASLPTLAEIKAALGIADNTKDAAITAALETTIAIIERYLNRGIAYATLTQEFEPIDTRDAKLMLSHFPVDEVTAVRVDGAVRAAGSYRVYRKQGVLHWRDGCCWPHNGSCGAEPVIEVDYSGGYADDEWPADLAEAVMRAFYGRWNATNGTGNAASATVGAPIRSYAVDGLSISYADAGASVSDALGGAVIPADLANVAALLEPYRVRTVTGI